MIVPAGSRIQDVSAGARLPAGDVSPAAKFCRPRHGSCLPSVFLKKDSHSTCESVDFFKHRVTAGGEPRRLAAVSSRWAIRRRRVARLVGWNQGAARSGNRKRTRVRVACGGGIRPRGLGRQPIHGHFGLSVVGGERSSPVVLQPACELRVRQRHFSRGPGLLAALKHGTSAPLGTSPTARMGAGEHRIVRATRRDDCIVIRAASFLICPPERPAAGRGAHPTGQRTRLRNA
mgnify:CR=1 FL=1